MDEPILIVLHGTGAEKGLTRNFITRWCAKQPDSALSVAISDVMTIDDIELADNLGGLSVKLKSRETAEGEPLSDDKFDVIINSVTHFDIALLMSEIKRNGIPTIKRGGIWRIL